MYQIKAERLSNAILVRALREWKEAPGPDDYQVGEQVDILGTKGWLTGTISRIHPVALANYVTYRTYSVMIEPGVIEIGHAPFMRRRTESSNQR